MFQAYTDVFGCVAFPASVNHLLRQKVRFQADPGGKIFLRDTTAEGEPDTGTAGGGEETSAGDPAQESTQAGGLSGVEPDPEETGWSPNV